MRKNASRYQSKKYPNLYKYPDSPNWVFRKYSKEKRDTFRGSTGIARDEARAYKKGIELFDSWLGSKIDTSRGVLVKDLARAVLASKESLKGGKRGATYRSARNQIQNHIIPAFGHLRPDQITGLKWELYDAEERKRLYVRPDREAPYQRTKLANTRKYLIEILRRAHDEGLIDRVPELKNKDGHPAPPRHLTRQEIRRILHHASPVTKLLAFILWKQGARPGEVLQYRFSMINFDEGKSGVIHVPAQITKTGRPRSIPLNSRVARILRWLRARVQADLIFASQVNPGEPMRSYKTAWATACRKAGVLGAQIYHLRDTFITDRLNEGLSATFVAKYVDNSALMIERKYAVATEATLGKIAG